MILEVRIDESEAFELVLVDRTKGLSVNRGQVRFLFGEVGIKVAHIFAVLLQMKG